MFRLKLKPKPCIGSLKNTTGIKDQASSPVSRVGSECNQNTECVIQENFKERNNQVGKEISESNINEETKDSVICKESAAPKLKSKPKPCIGTKILKTTKSVKVNERLEESKEINEETLEFSNSVQKINGNIRNEKVKLNDLKIDKNIVSTNNSISNVKVLENGTKVNVDTVKVYLNCWPKEWPRNEEERRKVDDSANCNVILLRTVPKSEQEINYEGLTPEESITYSENSEPTTLDDSESFFENKSEILSDEKLSDEILSDTLKDKRTGTSAKLNFKPLVPKPVPKVVAPKTHSSSSESKNVAIKPNTKYNGERPKVSTSTYGRLNQEMQEKFLLKFGEGPPDHEKLTMLDLIFYNPKSNPMSRTPEETVITNKESKRSAFGDVNEEDVDDVSPTPQLKVDAEGNIVIDTDTKNNGECNNEDLVQPISVDKEFPVKRGGSSPESRSKHVWSYEETIKFYKALHTIGPDFSLMTTVFPDRSRKTLKFKFKREERVNCALIDKVLRHPADFDFKALENELAEDEKKSCNAIIKRRKSKVTESPTENCSVKKVNSKKRPSTKRLKLTTSADSDFKPKASISLASHSNWADSQDLLIASRKVSFVQNNYLVSNIKKSEGKKSKHRSRISTKVRNLQSILEQDDLEEDIETSDTTEFQDDRQIIINTNIHYDHMKIVRSVSYNAENFNRPVDVNVTIEHKPTDFSDVSEINHI